MTNVIRYTYSKICYLTGVCSLVIAEEADGDLRFHEQDSGDVRWYPFEPDVGDLYAVNLLKLRRLGDDWESLITIDDRAFLTVQSLGNFPLCGFSRAWYWDTHPAKLQMLHLAGRVADQGRCWTRWTNEGLALTRSDLQLRIDIENGNFPH